MHRKLIVVLALLTASLPAHADSEESPELVKWYGFARLDAIYDDSRLSNIQFPQWVELEPDGPGDDNAEFSIHPRLTRLGVDIAPQQLGSLNASGKIEIDFQNGGGEARQLIRLREGYLEIKYDIFELLAGQTWDLISPLHPSANGDSLMWNTGNVGDRRPQLRGSVVLPASGGALRLSAMAGQTGAVDGQDLDDDGRLDGLESATPTVQGLAEFVRRGFRIGMWAHGGFEEVATPINEIDGFGSWAAGGHIVIPIENRAWFKGEVHRGRNLTDIRGGIGQAINPNTGNGIRSTGAWAEFGTRIRDPYTLIVGGYFENPDDRDIEDGARELNWAYSITQHIKAHERLTVGVEYIFWKTDYKNSDSGTANRGNVWVRMSF